MTIRSRIVEHLRVRARDLVPHEMNPRVHSTQQKQALQALYERIGFARSLLAYRLPDGRLKLIDGHLRASMDPEYQVDVEVLDVNDEEARVLLLSLDPLAALAGFDQERVAALQSTVATDNQALADLWTSVSQAEETTRGALQEAEDEDAGEDQEVKSEFLVIVKCKDEKEQAQVLRACKGKRWNCKAVLS